MSDNWPARGLISARVEPPGTLVLGCDCGTTTRLVVQDAETLTEIQEIADYYSRQTPPLRTEPRRVTILSAQ